MPETSPRPIKWLLDRNDGIRHIYVEEMEQRDGSFLFAVRKMGYVLTREGEWEWEPQPSSRTDDYLARARFTTMDEALAAYRAERAA